MGKKKFERTCTVCSDKYLFCPNCSEFDRLPRWMDAYCSENCKDLYNITAGWLNNWLDKDVEIARLKKADLSKLKDFPKWMQDTISEMQAYVPEVSADVIAEVLFEDKPVDDKKPVEKPVEEKKETEEKVDKETVVENNKHEFNNGNYKKIKPKYNK